MSIVDPSGFSLPYDYSLCNSLSDIGIDVRLYTTSEENPYRLPNREFELIEHYYTAAKHYPAQNIFRLIMKGVDHIVNQFRLSWSEPDVFHFQWAPIRGVDALMFRYLRSKTPVVFTAHNIVPHEPSRLDYPALRLLYSSVDHFIVHTHASRQDLVQRFDIDQSLITVIPHGNFSYLHQFDPDLNQLSNEVQSLIDRPTILSFGLIREYKRLDRTIRAFSHIQEEIPDAALLVVGEPRVNMDKYYDLVKELGLTDMVTFVPEYVADELIPSYFEIGDVCVFPYERIDQSGAALLSATMGKPIVATDVGGLSDVVIPGKNGAIVDGTPKSIASALIPILEDREYRDRLGRQSRKYSNKVFSWDSIADRTKKVYQTVLNDRVT